jgi:hypothetical protein
LSRFAREGADAAVGRSPSSTASTPPTTPPSAACAAPSATAKVSLGSQSDAGERFAERMLSIPQTRRLQRRSLFAYLIDAIRASARGSPAPSLA